MKHIDDFTHKDEELVTPPQGPVPLEWPQDLSPRVIELARFIDRLPAGTHLIEIKKPEVRAMDWHVEISTVLPNRVMTLSKKKNGAQP